MKFCYVLLLHTTYCYYILLYILLTNLYKKCTFYIRYTKCIFIVPMNNKKCKAKVRTSSSRASKRAPTLHSCTVTPKSLSGQSLDRFWIGSGLSWPERDFGVVSELFPVGACFEALDAMIFIAPSDFIGIFLRP